MSQSNSLDNKYELALRDLALGYPGAHEDMPWGHRALKVKGKAFLFMGHEGGGLGLSVKLPQSNSAALMMPFATPTGYGLGKSGWVSASFAKGEKPPMEMLRQWVDESYRAVAPKKLVDQLGSSSVAAGQGAPKRNEAKDSAKGASARNKPAAAKKAASSKKAAAPKRPAAAKKPAARKQAGTRAKQVR
ncbi:MmcQ/YjbR family DNA-binding protein [Hyalangium sp.]|uniref:MmcQ/YjbR family DNA-binding protein n=1 Tax=Hyalangium sp. TaxID=2028555 RepID=UPI002D31F093|nr:MmcQ/YjbR family DNA-binding protein [Hyalangium sp.]HYH98280.1 MmcQ/YjbR family DNA-binding protein [Hyalangium sp.]